MRLIDLLKDVDCEIYGDNSIEIENLTHNSKEVKEGGLFFAIKGEHYNGEEFVDDAIKQGANVVVSENKLNLSCTNVVVKNIRKAMSLIANNFYLNPAEKMLIIGVTGTNGKTTTTYMLKSIFEEAGKNVGVIGTNGIIINGKKTVSNFTTPDPIILQKTLREMVDAGVNVVCMETSAHALKLQKLWGVMTDIALFTNLSQDHLDYFKNMDDYFIAKKSFFSAQLARFGVVNIDDPYGKIIYDNADIPLVSYSKENNREADVMASNIISGYYNQEFNVKSVKGDFKVNLNMLGSFNVSNALCAISAAIMAGVEQKHIINALKNLEQIEGRFNTYFVKGVRVIVDYAHTPDGLENILKAARVFTEKNLISVFGCGGNRDVSKRHIMGQISTSLADLTVITSDNSRLEDPIDIIEDIERGVENNKYMLEIDRILAIKKAVNLACRGDTVLILGKGAENYFDVNGEKIPYITDAGIIKEIQKEESSKIEKEAIYL